LEKTILAFSTGSMLEMNSSIALASLAFFKGCGLRRDILSRASAVLTASSRENTAPRQNPGPFFPGSGPCLSSGRRLA